MPAKKGTNHFDKYQQEKQDGRGVLIAEFLDYLRTSRVKHEYVTDLADMVAKHIEIQQGKPCNKATLLRNPKYKAPLLSFMAETKSAGTKGLKVKKIEDPEVQAMVLTAQVDSSNLKRDNDRLRAYVTHLEDLVAEASGKLPLLPSVSPDEAKLKLEQAQILYAKACQSLQLVIRHLNSIVSVDVSSRRIIDMTRTRGNIIVDSDIADSFFDWLEANKGIG